MKITINVQELLDMGAWEAFCYMTGRDASIADKKTSNIWEYTITSAQAKELGII